LVVKESKATPPSTPLRDPIHTTKPYFPPSRNPTSNVSKLNSILSIERMMHIMSAVSPEKISIMEYLLPSYEEIYHGNTKTEEFVENCFGQKEPNTRLAFYRKVNN
jgi:hypothetical protein